MTASIYRQYSKQELWSLFLMSAFAPHVWTLLLAFRDLSWVAERTNAWDAIGVASYGAVFAFLESLVVFLVFASLGFLIARQWGQETRLALLSVLVLVLSFWAIVNQLYFLLNISFPEPIIRLFAQAPHPLRVLYMIATVLVAPTVILPAWLVLRSNKVLQFMRGIIERLSLLTTVYLFFDVAGLVIVIIRNIS